MRRILWGVCVLIIAAWAASGALAQSQNVAYYEKTTQSGGEATYERTHSLYVAGAHNEPVYPGDQVVDLGGAGGCDGPPGQVDCLPSGGDEDDLWIQADSFLVHENGLSLTEGGFWIQGGGDGTPDRIRVPCGSACAPFRALIIITPPFAPNPEDLVAILRDIADRITPDEAEACTSQKIGDMGGLLNSILQSLIANFLNSPAAMQMWLDSNYVPGMGYDLRQEAAGLLYPDGTFQPLPITNNGPCGGQVPYNGPALHDTGAIFVHTQPFGRGESPVCPQNPYGGTYGNRPSGADVQWMANYGVDLGLIIDADGIIVFTPDYNPNHDPINSDEAHYKVDDDGKCGVDRY